MNEDQKIKEMVKERYSKIALNENEVVKSSCCDSSCSDKEVYNIMTDDYTEVDGYASDADLGLGCGLPTAFAKIKQGDWVLDLGSGAGNDCFIARHETGETGKVIGVDFSEPMIAKARLNADKLNYNNVEFRLGDIENLPVSDGSIDVIVSNCVLNLVPNKEAVIKEMYRVLKNDGHFSISDIVLVGELSDAFKAEAELYAGCVSGAIQKSEYLGFIKTAGFENVDIQKQKEIKLPDQLLKKYLTEYDIQQFKNDEVGIYSITVFGQKKSSCCS